MKLFNFSFPHRKDGAAGQHQNNAGTQTGQSAGAQLQDFFPPSVNFRDLGGIRSADGRTIRPGLLYRSGGLYLLDDREQARFRTLGVRFVLDLRTSAECEKRPDPSFPDVTMLRHSGLIFRGGEEIDFSPEGMSRVGETGIGQIRLLRSYYRSMPFENEAFSVLFQALRSGDVPIVFHCATGKDRTGVAAMLLLLALGVPGETALEDYLQSNAYHAQMLARELSANREKIAAHPELETLIRMRCGVTEEIGKEALDAIFTKYPSPEDLFYVEYGFDETSLAALRDAFLD